MTKGGILDATGDPQPDLDVSALRRTDKAGPLQFVPNGHGRTNDLGEFRIAGLAAGDYIVLASLLPRGPLAVVQTAAAATVAPTYFPGTLTQNDARVMALVPGQVIATVDFVIASVAAYRVSGMAVDEAGRPSPRALVFLVALRKERA